MPVATMTTGRPPYVPEKERFGAPNGVFVQTFNPPTFSPTSRSTCLSFRKPLCGNGRAIVLAGTADAAHPGLTETWAAVTPGPGFRHPITGSLNS